VICEREEESKVKLEERNKVLGVVEMKSEGVDSMTSYYFAGSQIISKIQRLSSGHGSTCQIAASLNVPWTKEMELEGEHVNNAAAVTILVLGRVVAVEALLVDRRSNLNEESGIRGVDVDISIQGGERRCKLMGFGFPK